MGFEQRTTDAWLARARMDAMKHIARDIPDPAEYAYQMPLIFATALVSAPFHKNGWRIPNESMAASLRPYGLVEYGGRFLTAFGMQVRKVLVEQMS